MTSLLDGLTRKLWFFDLREDRGFATAISAIGPMLASFTLVAALTATQTDSLADLSSLVSGNVDRLASSMQVQGTVLAQPDAEARHLDSVTIPLTLLTDSDGVSLSEEGSDRGLFLIYRDSDEEVVHVPFEVEWLDGDGDSLLEYGEMARLTASLDDLAVTPAGEQWTIELISEGNVELSVSRRLPAILQPLMALP